MKTGNLKFVSITAVLALMVLLTACPYYSSVPISEPGEKVPKILYGKWVEVNKTEMGNPDYYLISKSDKGPYIFRIEEFVYNEDDSAYTAYEYWGHLSKIKDATFMNVRDGDDGSYYLYRLEFEGKMLTLKEITENITETFDTPEALAAFIEKHMNISFFYNSGPSTYQKMD